MADRRMIEILDPDTLAERIVTPGDRTRSVGRSASGRWSAYTQTIGTSARSDAGSRVGAAEDPGQHRRQDQVPEAPPAEGASADGLAAMGGEGQDVLAAITRTFGDDVRFVVIPLSDPVTSDTLTRVVQQVPALVAVRRQALTEQNISALVDVMMVDDPAADVLRAIEQDQAALRVRFLQQVPTLNSREIQAIAGHRAGNQSATASRWKAQKRIFAVPFRGQDLYPAFQFQDAAPHPTVGRVLAALPETMTPWQVALWWFAPNGWIDGARPMDHIAAGDRLTEAAERLREPVEF